MKALSLIVLTLFLALPTKGACWDAVVDDVTGEAGQIANPTTGNKVIGKCDKVWGTWCHDFTLWQVTRHQERTCKLSPEDLRVRLTALKMTQHVYPSVNEVWQQLSPEQRQMTTYDATCRDHIKHIESFLVPWDVIIMIGHSGIVAHHDTTLQHAFGNSEQIHYNKLSEIICDQVTKDTEGRTPRSKGKVELWRWVKK